MLHSIRIVNVQSIKDITYHFSNGLNVLVAENNTGKSVLIKLVALLPRIHKTTESERRQYISFGCSKSDIYFYCSTGFYWLEICLNRVSFYGGDSPENVVYLGNELPDGLREGLSLLVCDDGLVANLITEDQSKFLVESDSRVNYSIFKLMTTDENSEKLIERCENKYKSLTGDAKVLEGTKGYLVSELSRNKKVDLSQQEYVLGMTKPLIDLGDELISIFDELDGIREISTIVSKQKTPNDQLKGLINLASNLIEVKDSLSRVEYVKNPNVDTKFLKAVNDLIPCVDVMKGLSDLKPIDSNLKGLCGLAESLSRFVNPLKNVSQLPKSIPNKNFIKLLEVLEEMKDCVYETKSLMETVDSLEDEIEELESELDSFEGEVHDCPIHGTIKFVDGKECIPFNNR